MITCAYIVKIKENKDIKVVYIINDTCLTLVFYPPIHGNPYWTCKTTKDQRRVKMETS